MAIRKETLNKLLKKIISGPNIKDLISSFGIKSMPLPKLYIVSWEQLGRNIAGSAHEHHEIHLADWLLYDADEAKLMLNHEIAHCLISYCNIPYKQTHGKDFRLVLRILLRRRWKEATYWKLSLATLASRKKLGVKMDLDEILLRESVDGSGTKRKRSRKVVRKVGTKSKLPTKINKITGV